VKGRLHDVASDRRRFEDIYRTTRVPVLGYLARRTASPEDAADLVADVYLIAWRRIADAPAGDEARLWLFGVARRVLANHSRRRRTETYLASALRTELRLIEPDVLGSASDSQREAVRAALAELGARDRELLMLSAWEGLSPAELAVVLARPAALVRVQLHRARRRLREKLASKSRDLEDAPAPLPRHSLPPAERDNRNPAEGEGRLLRAPDREDLASYRSL